MFPTQVNPVSIPGGISLLGSPFNPDLNPNLRDLRRYLQAIPIWLRLAALRLLRLFAASQLKYQSMNHLQLKTRLFHRRRIKPRFQPKSNRVATSGAIHFFP